MSYQRVSTWWHSWAAVLTNGSRSSRNSISEVGEIVILLIPPKSSIVISNSVTKINFNILHDDWRSSSLVRKSILFTFSPSGYMWCLSKKKKKTWKKPCRNFQIFLMNHFIIISNYLMIYFFLFWVKFKLKCSMYSMAVNWPSISSLAGREPSCCDPTFLLWSKNSVKALGEEGGMKYEWIQLCFDGYVSKYPSKRLLKARKSVCVVEIGSSSLLSLPASACVAFHFIF